MLTTTLLTIALLLPAQEGIDDLRAKFAQWRLDAATDAGAEDLDGELAALRSAAEALALEAPRDEAARALLTDVQARALAWLAESGDVESTAAEVVALRLLANERSAFPRRTLALAATATLAREDVCRLIDALPEGAERAALPAPQDGSDDAVIANAVRRAAERGDTGFIGQLGSRAVPTMRELALALDGSPIPAGRTTPLVWLLNNAPEAGLDVALELLRRDDFLLKRHVLHALVGVFDKDEVWAPVGATDWRLQNDEWTEILRIVMTPADEATRTTASIVSSFAARGVVPANLLDDAVSILVRFDYTVNAGRVIPEGALPYYRALLGNQHADSRRRAVLVLRRTPSAADVLRLADDPDPGVRRVVAQALDTNEGARWIDSVNRSATESTLLQLDPDEAYVAAVRRLLGDKSDVVRGAAWGAVDSRTSLGEGTVVSAATQQALLEQGVGPDVQERIRKHIPFLPEDERIAAARVFLTARASDEGLDDEERTNALEALLGDLFESRSPSLDAATYFWPFVAMVEDVSGFPPGFNRDVAQYARHYIENEGLDPVPFVAWLEVYATDEAWSKAISDLLWAPSNALEKGSWFGRLSSVDRARVLRAVGDRTIQTSGPGSGGSIRGLRHGQVGIDGEDLVKLVLDPSVALDTRRWAAEELAVVAPEQLVPGLLPTLVEVVRARPRGLEFMSTNAAHPDLDLDALDALLADSSVPDTALLRVEARLDRASTVENVIERFPPETWTDRADSNLLMQVVSALIDQSPDAVDPRLPFANVAGSKLQGRLAWELGRSRSQAYFPLLADVLRSAPLYGNNFDSALDAVTSYLNDDAAALLLETAKRMPNETVRAKVLERLGHITEYQDAAARWQQRRDASARRAEAIDRLVAVTEDSSMPVEARAEALRGLGLLDAVEELPRLVEALTSSNEEFRSAARAAIDRLHRETDEKDD
ncbi:MAG: hypothetical protein AAGA20_01425 [Planctomycetota bacterium]